MDGRKVRQARRHRAEAASGEVLQGQGMATGDSVRQIGVTRQTYYRRRKQYGEVVGWRWWKYEGGVIPI